MDTKPLLYGLIGFFIGGLLVSVAATTFDKPEMRSDSPGDMTMSQMSETLMDKSGDAYDKEFIAGMIEHHQGAIDMAKLSASRAKHAEIKQLSKDIISAQNQELVQMKQWQKAWGYDTSAAHEGAGGH